MARATKIRQHGFTLGETLAALAVAGIGFALAIPGLQTLASNNTQAVASNQLVASLTQARSAAITRNRRVVLCASSDADSCDGSSWQDGWIIFVDDNLDWQRDAGETLLGQLPATTLALSSSNFPDRAGYSADGRLQGIGGNSSGQFLFCEAGSDEALRAVLVPGSGLPKAVAADHPAGPFPCPAQAEG